MNYRKDLILGEAFGIFILILFPILDFLYLLVYIFIFDDVTYMYKSESVWKEMPKLRKIVMNTTYEASPQSMSEANEW